MFALGMVYWLFDSKLKYTEDFIEEKFGKKPLMAEANSKVLRAGYYYAETIQAIAPSYRVSPANIEKGTYRNINGNQATSWGLLAAAEKAGLKLFHRLLSHHPGNGHPRGTGPSQGSWSQEPAG